MTIFTKEGVDQDYIYKSIMEDNYNNARNHHDDNNDSDASDHDTEANSDGHLDTSPDTNYSDANAEVMQVFKGDDRSVFWWRIVVKAIMIFVAILLTILTYIQLSMSERNDFEASVSGFLQIYCGMTSHTNFVIDFWFCFCLVRPLQ